MKWMWLVLLFFALLTLPVTAETTEEFYEQQFEASGADELFSLLPEETRVFLRAVGIEGLDPDEYTALKPQNLLETLLEVFGAQAGSVTATCGLLLGVILLGAIAESMKQTVKEGQMAEMFSLICSIAACGAVLLPVSACIQGVCEAADGVSVLMLSFVPIYAALILAGGQATLATSYSTVLLAGAQCVSALLTGVATPLLTVSLGMTAAGTLSEKNRLGALGGMMAKFAGWLLATVTGVFTALMSMQSLVAASADSLGQRAAKMSLANFIPIVGGALSETFGTVTGCLRLLRSTLGMFGILAAAALVLPSFFRCFTWSIAIGICRMAAEVCEVKPVVALLGAVQTVMKTLMGILAVCALFLIVTTTVVTLAGGM